MRTAVSNRGLEAGKLEKIYLEDDEVFTDQEAPHALEIRTLLSSVFGGEFRAEIYGGSGERTQNRLVMVAGINTLYLRAVAKVAFHYFLWACPILRGNEPAFTEIRDFISDGTGNWRDLVQLDAPAIDVIAAHCDGCSGPCSRTILIARSRTSGEYFLGLAMGSILSRNEPSEKPGTIQRWVRQTRGAAVASLMNLTRGRALAP